MDQHRLIVVDDDGDIRELLSTYLQNNGFKVTAFGSGEDFLEQGFSDADLLILDIGLPGIDGLDICRSVRSDSQIPIIMLTAAADDVDRILGLELGADDYLGKPFNPRELLARIRALLRRAHVDTEQQANSALLQIDSNVRRVFFKGEQLDLTGAEFDLLNLLNTHRGQIVSREQLCLKLKGHPLNPLDRSIDTQISRLRAKLPELEGQNPIKAVRGKGYQLVLK